MSSSTGSHVFTCAMRLALDEKSAISPTIAPALSVTMCRVDERSRGGEPPPRFPAFMKSSAAAMRSSARRAFFASAFCFARSSSRAWIAARCSTVTSASGSRPSSESSSEREESEESDSS